MTAPFTQAEQEEAARTETVFDQTRVSGGEQLGAVGQALKGLGRLIFGGIGGKSGKRLAREAGIRRIARLRRTQAQFIAENPAAVAAVGPQPRPRQFPAGPVGSTLLPRQPAPTQQRSNLEELVFALSMVGGKLLPLLFQGGRRRRRSRMPFINTSMPFTLPESGPLARLPRIPGGGGLVQEGLGLGLEFLLNRFGREEDDGGPVAHPGGAAVGGGATLGDLRRDLAGLTPGEVFTCPTGPTPCRIRNTMEGCIVNPNTGKIVQVKYRRVVPTGEKLVGRRRKRRCCPR